MHDGISSNQLPVCGGGNEQDRRVVRRFDYGSVSSEHARTLKRARGDIHLQMSTAAKAIVEIGRQLLIVKALLDRGQFVQWVETECVFSLRSAENYLRVARFVDEKNATVANLPPATLYLISARNAPPEFVSDVLALAA